MRKTSVYARKRAHAIKTNGDLLYHYVKQCNTIGMVTARCTPYEVNAKHDAQAIMVKLRTALQKMIDRAVPDGDTKAHDYIIISFGEAKVRYLEIGGRENNPALDALTQAELAMKRARERHDRIGQWGLDGPAIEALKTGVDLYEQVLMLSTPQQMADAASTLHRWLKLQLKGNV